MKKSSRLSSKYRGVNSSHLAGVKVAIVYDRVNKWGGAERVLLDLHKIFPQSDLYTSVYDPDNAEWACCFENIYPSFLNKFNFAKRNHEYFAWAMPVVFERFNLSKYDLVISVTSEAAKGVITSPSQKHISIILTPTRYLWSAEDEYFSNKYLKYFSAPARRYLKKWDIKAANRPDKLVAISREVQSRISKYYDLESEIIYPAFTPLKNNSLVNKTSENYYLLVSRLVKYKKADIVINAFNKLGKNLYITGTGRDENYLKSLAKNNIRFLGKISDEELANYYTNAKALIFPQLEDYGLTPLESQSFGTPVIAYRAGGALETIVENNLPAGKAGTGLFFDYQTEDSIIDAISRFETQKFDKREIKRNASKFSFEKFKDKLLKLINNV